MAATPRTAAPPPPPAALPRWADTVRRKYVGGEASMFVLHHNVFDQVLVGERFYTLVDFLCEVLLRDNKDTILVYDPSAGVRYATRIGGYPTSFQVNAENLGDKRYWSAAGGALLASGMPRMF